MIDVLREKRKPALLWLLLCTLQFGVMPVQAQSSARLLSGTRLPISQDASGLSFRKGNDQETMDPSGKPNIRPRNFSTPTIGGVTYQVHVLGEVELPGTYRVSPSDRLFEALQQAGGIGRYGSKRKIELRRGQVTHTVDLLKFQLFGSLQENPFLQDNDVVYVSLKSAVIQVVGAVKRPEEYEIVAENNLFEAIQLAGGFTVGVAKQSLIRVIRFEAGKKTVLEISMNDDAMKKFPIQAGDVIVVPNVITQKNSFDYDLPVLPGDNVFYPSYEDRIFILGGVTLPGAYSFNPYYNLSQYLSLAGGTTKLATRRINLLSPDGRKKRVTEKERNSITINPGDTILVGERRIPPEGWVNIVLGIAGFGLSSTATVLALTR